MVDGEPEGATTPNEGHENTAHFPPSLIVALAQLKSFDLSSWKRAISESCVWLSNLGISPVEIIAATPINVKSIGAV